MSSNRLTPSDDVETVELEGDILVWDGEMLHLLAGWGAEIWQRIDGLSTAEEIAADFAAMPVGPPADVEREVVGFLDELIRAQVLEAVPAGRGPRYAVPEHVGHVRDEDVLVVVLYGTGSRRTLSPTAARIWELAGARFEVGEVVKILRTEFPDAPATLDHDVRALLDQLVASGLLVQIE